MKGYKGCFIRVFKQLQANSAIPSAYSSLSHSNTMKYTTFAASAMMLAVAVASPTARSDDFKSEMLASHNYFRGQHSANPLGWDNNLAQASQTWANTCNFYHDVSSNM